MIDKLIDTPAHALADVPDGANVMIGGFGTAGLPNELTDALLAQRARDLTIVSNNAGNGDTGLEALSAAGRVRKMICSFPRQTEHSFAGLSGQLGAHCPGPESRRRRRSLRPAFSRIAQSMVFEASRLRGRAAFKLTVTTACSWPELSVRGSARKPMPAVEVAYSD